jgi:hypothetical protein
MPDDPKPPTVVQVYSTVSERVHLVSVFLHREEQLHPATAAALENMLKVSVEAFVKAWSL